MRKILAHPYILGIDNPVNCKITKLPPLGRQYGRSTIDVGMFGLAGSNASERQGRRGRTGGTDADALR